MVPSIDFKPPWVERPWIRHRWTWLLALIFLGLASCAPTTLEQPPSGGTAVEAAKPGAARLVRMGRRALEAGDLGVAASLFSQALTADPTSAEAGLGLGEAALALDKGQEASDAFGHVLRHDPDHREARLGFARAMIALGRGDAAIDRLEPLLDRGEPDDRLLNLLAVSHDLDGRHGEAAALYRRALEREPESLSLQNNLALSLALSGATDEALAILEPLAEGTRSTSQVRQNLALVHGLAGNLVAAERISRLDLDSKAVSNNLAYFSALRALAPSRSRSAVLRPRPDAAAGPVERPRGPKSRVAGLALSGADLGLGLSPIGSWVIDLGRFPSTAAAKRHWSALKDRHGDIVASLSRLGGSGEGTEPLLVGPIVKAEAAEQVCRALETAAKDQPCRPIRL